MGGGRRFHYPSWVWTPSGGWWPVVPRWPRNTAILTAAALCLAVCSGVAVQRLERHARGGDPQCPGFGSVYLGQQDRPTPDYPYNRMGMTSEGFRRLWMRPSAEQEEEE